VDSLAALDLVALTRALVDIDSTTGREAEACRWMAAYLSGQGWTVVEQPVDADRFNVMATAGAPPRVVLSTHIDCVPPFFGSRLDGDVLYGRGACDAKGILATQVTAAERLRAGGEQRLGLLIVVGEERGSDGAIAAAGPDVSPRFLVNGEPTGNRLGVATRGAYRVKLSATGRACHSAFPEEGESAVTRLLAALGRLAQLPLPTDPVLGSTHYNIGVLHGGVAPNVIPASAEADVMFRTVGDAGALDALLTTLTSFVDVEPIIEVPPVRLRTLDGFDTVAVPYTTDIPLLKGWGTPLLVGPGSALVAHTDEERIAVAELEEGVETYVRLVSRLLDSDGA